MTTEKPTMADLSGEKRNRNSSNTAQPATNLNKQDSKALVAGLTDPNGPEIDKKTVRT
jgi:hypothetical protein